MFPLSTFRRFSWRQNSILNAPVAELISSLSPASSMRWQSKPAISNDGDQRAIPSEYEWGNTAFKTFPTLVFVIISCGWKEGCEMYSLKMNLGKRSNEWNTNKSHKMLTRTASRELLKTRKNRGVKPVCSIKLFSHSTNGQVTLPCFLF